MNNEIKPDHDFFMRQAGLATLILDISMKVKECNLEFLRIAKMEKNEVIGADWHDLIVYDYPYSPLEHNQLFEDYKAVPSGKFWCSLKKSSGKTFLLATLSKNSISSEFYVTLYDVTDQLSPERLIHDGGLLTIALAESINGPMGIHDSKGIIKFASDEICRMLGVNRKDIVGHHISEFFGGEDVERWMKYFENCKSGIPKRLEFDSLKKNEKVFHVMAMPRVIFDSKKNIQGCVFLFSRQRL